MQFSRISIRECDGPSLIAQSAKITGGFQLTDSTQTPAFLEGGMIAMNLEVGEDFTLADACIGTSGQPADLVLRSAAIESGLVVSHSIINGNVVASAVTIGGDLHIQASQLSNPGKTILDLRGSVIGGMLQFASLGTSDSLRCEFNGNAAVEAAEIGTVMWHQLKLGADSILSLTNITVTNRISAGPLLAGNGSQIWLSGTGTPLLEDSLDDEEDSWGAGKASLRLEEFAYGRLAYPSGRQSDDANAIRKWKGKWLARRNDQRSARPLRQLASALRTQGLFEASRLALVDAFSAEGRNRPTTAGRAISWLFGVFFGHGLSGSRASLTLLLTWLLGASAVTYLQDRDLLIPVKPSEFSLLHCSGADPLLFSADAMLPLDLGVNGNCEIGKGARATFKAGRESLLPGRLIFGETEIFRVAFAAFQLISWMLVSLAILTWSGLLKRGGRD